MSAVKRFVGPNSVEFDDGTVLDDVDALILCTDYEADWSIAPFVETSTSKTPGYGGPPIYRIYMNMFPPKYATNFALLNYSAFGKNDGFSFADVHSAPVSSVLRGIEQLPSWEAMEKHIDEHRLLLSVVDANPGCRHEVPKCDWCRTSRRGRAAFYIDLLHR
jgi:dimethylaniline monooxygenase (N-oxide forming)